MNMLPMDECNDCLCAINKRATIPILFLLCRCPCHWGNEAPKFAKVAVRYYPETLRQLLKKSENGG